MIGFTLIATINFCERDGIRKQNFWNYPRHFRHYVSLFPDFYLDPGCVNDEELVKSILSEYKNLIQKPDIKEIDILKWLKRKDNNIVIGSILLYYKFGHHNAFLFKEFPLGTDYRADFLLLGNSSDGYSMIFVELEEVQNKIIIDKGYFGESIRKGLNQISDWKLYLQQNYSTVKYELDKKIKRRRCIT